MRRLIGILAILFVSGTAQATETRLRSLGGAEQRFLVHDELNVLHLPSTLVLFPNVTFAELGTDYFDNGERNAVGLPYAGAFGFHYALGSDTVLAFYGSSSRGYVLSGPAEMIAGWSGAGGLDDELGGNVGNEDPIHAKDHKATLLFGHRAGKLRLGGMLGLWGDSYVVDKPEHSQKKNGGSGIDAVVGVGYDLPKEQSLDVAVRFGLGWFDDDLWVTSQGDGYVASRLDVSSEWVGAVTGRGVIRVGTEKLVPYLTAGASGGGVAWNQETAGAPDISVSRIWFGGGANLLLQPLDGVFIMPGAGLRWASESTSIKYLGGSGDGAVSGGSETLDATALNPYFMVAVDGRVAPWCSLRFSARQNLYWYGAETETVEGSASDTGVEVYMGVAFKVGQVDIDWMFNPTMLVDGPYMVSGRTNALATQAAVKFTW